MKRFIIYKITLFIFFNLIFHISKGSRVILIKDTTISKDSIYLDSIKIINKELEQKIYKFYRRNKNDIDSNDLIKIFFLPYNSYDDFTISISLEKGLGLINNNLLDNELTILNDKNYHSCYFQINNTLIFIRYFETDKFDLKPFFKKTTKQRLFYYDEVECAKMITGFPPAIATYRIYKDKYGKLKIKNWGYFKYYRANKLQRLYYNFLQWDINRKDMRDLQKQQKNHKKG